MVENISVYVNFSTQRRKRMLAVLLLSFWGDGAALCCVEPVPPPAGRAGSLQLPDFYSSLNLSDIYYRHVRVQLVFRVFLLSS